MEKEYKLFVRKEVIGFVTVKGESLEDAKANVRASSVDRMVINTSNGVYHDDKANHEVDVVDWNTLEISGDVSEEDSIQEAAQ